MSKGIGVMMMFMGVGGIVLPFLGLQFKVLSIFGTAQYVIAGVLALAGLGLLIFSKK